MQTTLKLLLKVMDKWLKLLASYRLLGKNGKIPKEEEKYGEKNVKSY